MSNINIKLDVQALQALELLGVKFDVVPDPQPVTIIKQLDKILIRKGGATLEDKVNAYLQMGQPLTDLGINLIYKENQNAYMRLEEKLRASQSYWPNGWSKVPFSDPEMEIEYYDVIAVKENTLCYARLPKHVCLLSDTIAWKPFNSFYSTVDGFGDAIIDLLPPGLKYILEKINSWYDCKYGFDDYYVSTDELINEWKDALSSNFTYESKIKQIERESLNNLHKYENASNKINTLQSERDKAVELSQRMVNSKTYSGWHAYYAMTYVRDNVKWYIESRRARNGGAGARVSLKEFNTAFDESAYFLTKHHIKDDELRTLFKELKLELEDMYKELNQLLINVKYKDGNPKFAVERNIKILKAVL